MYLATDKNIDRNIEIGKWANLRNSVKNEFYLRHSGSEVKVYN